MDGILSYVTAKGSGTRLQKHRPYKFLHRMPVEALCPSLSCMAHPRRGGLSAIPPNVVSFLFSRTHARRTSSSTLAITSLRVVDRLGLLSQPRTLNFPRYNVSNYGRRAFCFAGPYVWNSLPEHIRQSTSIAVFKRSLDISTPADVAPIAHRRQ